MKPNQQTHSADNPSPHQVPVAGADMTYLSRREMALVNVYQKLTGEDESHARGVFMHILRDDGEFNADLKT